MPSRLSDRAQVWDNTFSWFQSKTLMKQIDLHEPEHAVAAAVASAGVQMDLPAAGGAGVPMGSAAAGAPRGSE
jgi:hypothetical protein